MRHFCLLFLTMKHLLLIVVLVVSHSPIDCWDNGLLRTPPMGFLSWGRFSCNIDCVTYPDSCINEKLYMAMIDRIAEDGYLELGYNTVNIDDCWAMKQRDPVTKRLIADKDRFPNGIKYLVDYAQQKGVQLGIYGDVGTATCGGYPGTRSYNGSIDYTQVDARTFSDWGVGSLKLDGCYEPVADYAKVYPEYTKALSQQSHKIAFACSWPAYIDVSNLTDSDYALIKAKCNYWRNFDDITDSWAAVFSIIEFYRKHVTTFAKFHGPGGWFDPDMLMIGNQGLSLEQSKTQMAFWSLWSAPLLMSNDLRRIRPEFKQILQNKHLIEVNQDPLGIMGHVVVTDAQASTQVWVKKLSPNASGQTQYIVLYFNYNTLGVPYFMSYKLTTMIPELKAGYKYDVHDLFENNAKIGSLSAEQNLTLFVETSGSVRMVKLVPVLTNIF